MKKLKYRARKSKIGAEDFAIGKGHIYQKRGNGEDIKLHKVSLITPLGLIDDCVQIDTELDIADDIDIIYFTGYYNEYDGAEGLYAKIATREQQDIGMYINSKTATYKRVGVGSKVRAIWFGARGDGITNDLQALLAAFKYKSVELGNFATYKIITSHIVDIPISTTFELLGNSSVLDIEAPQTSVAFNFIANDILYFVISGVKFKGTVAKAFTLQNIHNVKRLEVYATTFENNMMPDGIERHIIQGRDQTITGKWTFLEPPTTSLEASQSNHPITKGFIDSLSEVPRGKYVRTTGANTVTGNKYYSVLKADSGVITKGSLMQYYNSFDVSGLIPPPPTLLEFTDTVPPIGSAYLQTAYSDTPNNLYIGTQWEKISEDVVDLTFLEGKNHIASKRTGNNYMYFTQCVLWKRIY